LGSGFAAERNRDIEYPDQQLIAALTREHVGWGRSRRAGPGRRAQSGRVPGSGAQVLDEVSAAIPGGVAAGNQ